MINSFLKGIVPHFDKYTHLLSCQGLDDSCLHVKYEAQRLETGSEIALTEVITEIWERGSTTNKTLIGQTEAVRLRLPTGSILHFRFYLQIKMFRSLG